MYVAVLTPGLESKEAVGASSMRGSVPVRDEICRQPLRAETIRISMYHGPGSSRFTAQLLDQIVMPVRYFL
jgi:hypothetical protein